MFQKRESSMFQQNVTLTRPSDTLVRLTRRAKRRTISYAATTLIVFAIVAALTLYGTGVLSGDAIDRTDQTDIWRALATLLAIVGAVGFWRLCLRAWSSLYDWRDLSSRRQMSRFSQK